MTTASWTGRVPAGAVAEAATALARAQTTGRPIEPVRSVIGDSDIPSAYAVQRELARMRTEHGAVVVGRKIGLTSAAVQRQLGVDQPDFGVLFADMDVSGRDEIPVDRLLQPKIEAEIAFVLAEDLDGELDDARVRAAVEYAAPALEIVDSRIAGWDISITDTIADNASSGLFVLADTRKTLAELEPRDVRMRLYRGDELVSEGDGAACLGDPIAALAWLARTARDFGEPLRAGQIVLSGALGPMVPVAAGDHFRAELAGLGEVSARFGGAR